VSWRLGDRLMTTLPPLCSPANPSRSPSTRPLLPQCSCCSWPLVACSLFPLQAIMNSSAESLPSMLMGTTLAGLVGRSPFRSPDRACFSPSGRRSGHRSNVFPIIFVLQLLSQPIHFQYPLSVLKFPVPFLALLFISSQYCSLAESSLGPSLVNFHSRSVVRKRCSKGKLT